MSARSIFTLIISFLCLFFLLVYGGRAFFGFVGLWSSLSTELNFVKDTWKFVWGEFFYSTPTTKYIAWLFLGTIGFRFLLGIFFNVEKMSLGVGYAGKVYTNGKDIFKQMNQRIKNTHGTKKRYNPQNTAKATNNQYHQPRQNNRPQHHGDPRMKMGGKTKQIRKR